MKVKKKLDYPIVDCNTSFSTLWCATENVYEINNVNIIIILEAKDDENTKEKFFIRYNN